MMVKEENIVIKPRIEVEKYKMIISRESDRQGLSDPLMTLLEACDCPGPRSALRTRTLSVVIHGSKGYAWVI